MPYSSVDQVPSYVPKDKRKQWLDVFNSAYGRAKGTAKEKEQSAFAQANGVAGPTSKSMTTDFQKFFLLEKYDEFRGIATGIATAEQKDRENEILDYAKSKPFFQAWSESVHKDSGGKSVGNLRLQHDDKKVAGKLNAIEFNDPAKLIRVEAQVIDPVAKELLQAGALTGFSIGGRYVEKSPQPDGSIRYVADPCEISVVDRPALPGAVFQSVKADGSIELRKFAKYVNQSDPVVVDACGHEDVPPAAVNGKSDEEEKDEDELATDRVEEVTPVLTDIMEGKAVRYLVPPDHLPVTDENGKPSHSHMGAAWAALHGGYRGNKYEGPDKEKAIAALRRLYESEGMETPDSSKSLKDQFTQDIERLSELKGMVKSIEDELEKLNMAEQDTVLDKAARHSIHQKIMAAKAHMDAHLDHCMKAHKTMHAHLDGLHKVIGGGPESMHEGGTAEEVTEGKSPSGSPAMAPGSSAIADKSDSYVEVGKDANGDPIFKRAADVNRPATAKEIAMEVARAILEVQKAASVAQIGDRSKARPFVKAATKEADADPEITKADELEMTPEDWQKYAAGDEKAVEKATRRTITKWNPNDPRLVRILNRQSDRAS